MNFEIVQINNKIPCVQLELQHRMRPRIADLIRPHIYKNLRDHDSVQLYGNVSGVQSNVFFLSHDHHEDNVADSKSKVKYLIVLDRQIVEEGQKEKNLPHGNAKLV